MKEKIGQALLIVVVIIVVIASIIIESKGVEQFGWLWLFR